MKYLELRTKEGRGLCLCLHHEVWHLGVSQDAGKGLVTKKWHPMPDLDTGLDKAHTLSVAWRGRGFGLASQGIY